MALFRREFIAVPDDRKSQIVYKWPDDSIRRFSRAIVDVDERALFVNQGQVVGTLDPGQHQIDADELPFLGAFIDRLSGGNAYRAELFFVGTREYTGLRFGGRIDDVHDPQTGLIVTLRVFGEYSARVTDPVKLVTTLTGTVDVTDNGSITSWVSDQLLKIMRSEVTTQISRGGWPVLGLSAYTAEIEPPVADATNRVLSDYGITLVRFGNFDVNLSDEDEANLKGLAKDTAYSHLAGGFQQYAAGEALLGAGEGMAKGGPAAGGAVLATGLGVGQQALAGGAAAPAPAPAPGPDPGAPAGPSPTGTAQTGTAQTGTAPTGTAPTGTAPTGTAQNGTGEAGAPAPRFCASCGAGLPSGARFCPSCGQAVAAPAGGGGSGG